ncbi:MAG: hypothetical protein WCD76_18060 [Pyrinomonadaceae bacterium]
MEPLRPTEREAILRNNPQANDALLDEYERLLVEEFASDPDAPQSFEIQEGATQREHRIADLYQLLFPEGGKSQSTGNEYAREPKQAQNR